MIAWASDGHYRKGYVTHSGTTETNYCDATDYGTATCTGGFPNEVYVTISTLAVEGFPEAWLEAIKSLRPPVVHERQMKMRPAREYVIPYNRKMLQQQYKQARR